MENHKTDEENLQLRELLRAAAAIPGIAAQSQVRASLIQKQSPSFLLSNHAHIDHHLGRSNHHIDLPPSQCADSIFVYLSHSFLRLDDPVQYLDVLRNQCTKYFRAYGVLVSKHEFSHDWYRHGKKLDGSGCYSDNLGIHHS